MNRTWKNFFAKFVTMDETVIMTWRSKSKIKGGHMTAHCHRRVSRFNYSQCGHVMNVLTRVLTSFPNCVNCDHHNNAHSHTFAIPKAIMASDSEKYKPIQNIRCSNLRLLFELRAIDWVCGCLACWYLWSKNMGKVLQKQLENAVKK